MRAVDGHDSMHALARGRVVFQQMRVVENGIGNEMG
jgi:hypothetical protein